MGYDITCFGEVLYDIYPDSKKLAGAPLNIAMISAKIGLRPFLISAAGESDYDYVKNKILSKNIRAGLNITKSDTGKSIVKLDKDKVPNFKIDKKCSFDFIEPSEDSIRKAEESKVFAFSSLIQRNNLSRNNLMKLLKRVKGIKIYDSNIRKGIKDIDRIIRDSIFKSDILKCNQEELEYIKKIFKTEKIISYIFNNTGISRVFVTLGKNGALCYTSNNMMNSAKIKNDKVIDTTGCGDSFIAGITKGLIEKRNHIEILEYGVKLSSYVAGFKGVDIPLIDVF